MFAWFHYQPTCQVIIQVIQLVCVSGTLSGSLLVFALEKTLEVINYHLWLRLPECDGVMTLWPACQLTKRVSISLMVHQKEFNEDGVGAVIPPQAKTSSQLPRHYSQPYHRLSILRTHKRMLGCSIWVELERWGRDEQSRICSSSMAAASAGLSGNVPAPVPAATRRIYVPSVHQDKVKPLSPRWEQTFS